MTTTTTILSSRTLLRLPPRVPCAELRSQLRSPAFTCGTRSSLAFTCVPAFPFRCVHCLAICVHSCVPAFRVLVNLRSCVHLSPACTCVLVLRSCVLLRSANIAPDEWDSVISTKWKGDPFHFMKIKEINSFGLAIATPDEWDTVIPMKWMGDPFHFTKMEGIPLPFRGNGRGPPSISWKSRNFIHLEWL